MTTSTPVVSLRRKGGSAFDVAGVVESLRQSREVTHNIRHKGKVRALPSPAAIREVLEGLLTALFPTHLGPHGLKHDSIDLFVANTLSTTLSRLCDQVARGLEFGAEDLAAADAQRKAEDIVRRFAADLPALRASLVGDLRTALRQDPESGSLGEILLCAEGFAAIFRHRVANDLNRHGARLVARIIARQGAA